MSSGDSPGPAELTFPGDGEMALRMRAYPWATSPLGDPRDWPASLRTACRICLTSRFPMIVWWGEELRFLYNDAYLPLLGSKHPALGRPGDQVWSEIWATIGPMLDSVLHTGQATWSEDLLLPMNRHGYWEETYWTYSYSPLHDDDGTVRGVFTAVRDTTEQVVGRRRLAALQDLGAQAGQARSVAEACDLVVRALDRAREVVPFAAIYLRGPDGGSTALIRSTWPGTDPSPLPGGPGGWPVDEVVRSGHPVTLTDAIARFGELPADGWQTPPAEAMVLPLKGGTGDQLTGVIVLAASAGRALDEAYQSFLGLVAQQTAALVNSAVEYQAQLRRAEELTELDRAKTTFFANVSHEFRTPLTLIMGPVEELRARLDPADGAAAQELDVIYRNGLRLGKLVNTLLDFSRIEAGRMQASFEPLDLGAFTTELASVFQSAIERAGMRYEVDCPSLSAPVYVDREMWEKVVFNLLSNALKFTFGGAVGVSLREEDGQAALRIADTGVGIAAAEIPRLFDRFHRIENAPSRSNEGSGIGLALVRELVGLHGGTISAESTENVGTTFTIRLPFGHGHLPEGNVVPASGSHTVPTLANPFLAEAMRWLPSGQIAEETAPAAPVAGIARRDADGKAAPARVLLADDNADMREYLQRLLRPVWTGTDQVTVVSTGSAGPWEALPAQLRDALAALRDQPLLTPTAGEPGGAGIRLEHPAGTLAIWIELDPGRVLTAEDRTLLSLVCGFLGQALHRAYQIDQQRETALTLQRAILGPSRLPTGFAVRYEPATRPLEVGGDWYDIVELPDGRIGIMVGDCVGHDLSAATVMGQLRSACRALLLQDASASQAVTAMDRFASFVPGAECATVFCGILDPGTGQLTYSSAAHPPGIVVHPDGRFVLLDGGRSLPLAIRQDAGRTEAAYVLPPRSTLLPYTDGLVERRGRPLTDGIAAAGAVVREASGAPLEDLAAQVMTRLAPAGGYEDDVAIVLYHHPAPLDITFAAESDQLAPVRARLRSWLLSCGIGSRTAQDVLVAVGEACANAIEHGHRHSPGRQVRLRAVSTANQLRLTITDTGHWRTSKPGDGTHRGHGIALMRALMQQVTIEPGPGGTTVDMYLRITHGYSA